MSKSKVKAEINDASENSAIKTVKKGESLRKSTKKHMTNFLSDDQNRMLENASKFYYFKFVTLKSTGAKEYFNRFKVMEIELENEFSKDEYDLQVLSIIIVFALEDVRHNYYFNEIYLQQLYRNAKGVTDFFNKVEELKKGSSIIKKITLDLHTVFRDTNGKITGHSVNALPFEIDSPYLLRMISDFMISKQKDKRLVTFSNYEKPELKPRKRKVGLDENKFNGILLNQFIELVETYFQLMPNRAKSQYKDDVVDLINFCAKRKWLPYPYPENELVEGAKNTITKKKRYDRLKRVKGVKN
jgi:hypothetical protein